MVRAAVSNEPSLTVTGPDAEAFVAYQSLRADLTNAVDFLTALLARASIDVPELDSEALALWNAAVVAYGRCFKGGARARYRIDVPAENRELHLLLLRHRDKHVAHRDRGSALQRESAALTLFGGRRRGVKLIRAPWRRVFYPDRGSIRRLRRHCFRQHQRNLD